MLKNSIPLSRNTSHGVNVLLQGVDPGFHSVPLHHIKLKSNFVSGQVVVGVGHTLPVDDISLLFDIDMVGDKVIMAPIISEDPSYEENELKKYSDFPACSVTLAMKKTLEEEDTLLQAGTIETSDVESKDTLFWLMSTITCYITMVICLVIS
jgi:hypothetical protein